jgi:hypothetical protein
VNDESKAFKAIRGEGVENANLPFSLEDSIAQGASHVMSKRIKLSKLAQKIGTKLCESMPRKMAEMGLTVEMEEVFREGNFVVMQLQVQHVDTRAVEKALGRENIDLTKIDLDTTLAGTLLEWCTELIGNDKMKQVENDFLPEMVQSKLTTKILEVMTEKFERKGLIIDVEILKEEQQARFFYRQLKELRGLTEMGS